MKKCFVIYSIFITGFVSAQSNFNLRINAPEFDKDSLFIQPLTSTGNINKIYNYDVSSDQQVIFDQKYKSVKIKINSENNVEGIIKYPQPFEISYYDPKINGGYMTKPFFMEKGDMKISISRKEHITLFLDTETPANKEYAALKKQLSDFDSKLKIFQNNDPNDIEAKHQFLQNYIRKNPNSIVAFWEIVSDFSRYQFNKSYLASLALFSKELKKNSSYTEFKKIIDIENSTGVGGNFPDVIFDKTLEISKDNFSKHTLTLVDYWSITCKPCIEDLPKLVELHKKFKEKGINFISVADENKKESMEKATEILRKNNVEWKNYFDVKKEFPKKLNASGYPLQILIDRNGKIVARKLGELDQIEDEIKKYLE
ncbi:TlpA disulfide reductase family protein [Chryseobacterium sp. Leaf394]|uniref:TlpA family protein disulfide reductase n=1 Tax=Chryseobacterium sp. Leaf394 TaxID=1736361 RepID=UPI0006F6F41A|nr:TlpA disulfide reductase family protein [Chryseobacterium sp. Leaf394]KQS94004.1 hypothetical protein ASG21_19565 [Chryseobacterium sp. Leaf394]